jgi:hypothetical protein
MKKWILSTLLVAIVATLALVFMPARQVQAACGTILTGSFASTAPNQTTPTFSVLAGDVVTAYSVDSNGTATSMGAEITINATIYNGGVTGTGSVTTYATAPASGTGSVFFYNQSGTGGTISWTVSISGPNCPGSPLAFTDGRVNPQAWATAVLYCNDGAIEVYDVDLESVGHLLFVTTPEEIAEVGVPANGNALIESGNGALGFVGLYRVASGDFVIVAPDTQPGKDYNFTFAGC